MRPVVKKAPPPPPPPEIELMAFLEKSELCAIKYEEPKVQPKDFRDGFRNALNKITASKENFANVTDTASKEKFANITDDDKEGYCEFLKLSRIYLTRSQEPDDLCQSLLRILPAYVSQDTKLYKFIVDELPKTLEKYVGAGHDAP